MADTIGGHGLFRLDAALGALVEHPERLERARNRFLESPSTTRTTAAYTFHSSDTATAIPSPEMLSDEQELSELRQWQLEEEHRASFPSSQFEAPWYQEERRLILAESPGDGTSAILLGKIWLPSPELSQRAKKNNQEMLDRARYLEQ